MYEFDLRPLMLGCFALGVVAGLALAGPVPWAVSYFYNHIQWVP